MYKSWWFYPLNSVSEFEDNVMMLIILVAVVVVFGAGIGGGIG